MRILQIVPHYIPATRFGGPQKVAHNLGRALVRLGHEVTVCTTNLADESRDLEAPSDVPVDLQGVKVWYAPTVMLRYWGFSPRLGLNVARELKAAEFVVVHFHYQFASYIGARSARLAGKPYVVFAHGSLHKMGIQRRRRLIKKAYLALLESRNLRNAEVVVFNAVEEQDASFWNERSAVVPNGIAADEFIARPETGMFRQRYPQLDGRLFLLFLGRLNVEQKGLDMLMPAFSQLRRTVANVHLVIAGPDENKGRRQLERMAATCGVSADVSFVGLLEGADKLAALQDADIFVLPSRSEGASIALLEALYMGVPVLVTNRVGLWREVERCGAGEIVEPDEESIERGLRRLSVAHARENCRGRAVELVRDSYTWDTIAAGFAEQARRIVGGRGRRGAEPMGTASALRKNHE